jgi:hypothetical protein
MSDFYISDASMRSLEDVAAVGVMDFVNLLILVDIGTT